VLELLSWFDIRWLMVFSPITTAIAWAMLVSGELDLQDSEWF
jgi:hypothetical protein